MQELHDNAESHNYYLSLIVNHKSEFCAKIALVAERTIKNSQTEDYISFRGTNGPDKINLTSHITKDKTEKVLVLLTCDIEFEQTEFFNNRVEEICKPKTYNNYSKGILPFDGKYRQNELFCDNWEYDWVKEQKIKDNNVSLDDLQIKTFLIQWISGDYISGNTLDNVLEHVNIESRGKSLDFFLNTLDNSIKPYFINLTNISYLQITDLQIEDLAKKCIRELNKYKNKYMIVEDIIDLLDLYIIDETLNYDKN